MSEILAERPAVSEPPSGTDELVAAVMVALESQSIRIAALETKPEASVFKRITDNAAAIALFLGLVLSFGSLRDTLWSKPEADRVSRISQFNQAVNSAANLRLEIIKSQSQIEDKGLVLAIMSMQTPQILNDVTTAKMIARDIYAKDIGIPQLEILISEAFTAGDLQSVKEFVQLAVSKTDVSPLLRSEAKRYEGKYYFASGTPDVGRQSYRDALAILGEAPAVVASRAYLLLDLVGVEYGFGSCDQALNDLHEFAHTLGSPYINLQSKIQMSSSMKGQLSQGGGQRCPLPADVATMLPL